MADSPGSTLSSLSSEDVQDEIASPHRPSRPSIDTHLHDGDLLAPPTKRRKTGPSLNSPGVFNVHDRAIGYQSFDDDDESLSDDTEGSAPGSPTHDEWAHTVDQVTACQWLGCEVGDLADHDELVKHVQDEHVAPKRAKHTCDWGECARKGTFHPSAYALKAHMRSHTKEKPYFCALPECDRSFTRSDALAKHLRTVHEPEPPKTAAAETTTAGPKKGAKIRLSKPSAPPAPTPHPLVTEASQNILNEGLDPSHVDYDHSPPNDNIQYIPAHHPITGQPGFMITYPPDILFTQFESEIPANQLMRLLRRQLHWAKEDAKELQSTIGELERVKAIEWIKKEVLLEEVMRREIEIGRDRGLLSEVGLADDMRNDIPAIKDALSTADARDAKNSVAASIAGKSLQDDLVDASDVDDGPGRKQQEDDMMAVGALMGLSGR